MQVAVIGGGRSGAAIVRAVRERGCAVTQHSRSTGFDVLASGAGDGSAAGALAFAGADVLVEATGSFTTSRRRATDFFTRSTRTVAAVAERLGARHVLLSIAQCTRPEVQGYGYFAGKTAQEALAAEVSPRLTVVRSTQWFEFAEQTLDRMRVGPIALVPGMTIAPVSLDAVAEVIADVVVGKRGRIGPAPASGADVVEVAGPEAMTLWEMTSALPRSRALPVPVPLPIPGRVGQSFRGGALLPDPGAAVVGPRFAEWLEQGQRRFE